MAAAAKPETQSHALRHARRMGGSKSDKNGNAGKDSTMSTQEEQGPPGVERRTLQNVVSEGIERVNRLADCVATATNMKLFGREPKVTYCRYRVMASVLVAGTLRNDAYKSYAPL